MGSDFTDDLRLAHVLADDADSLTESRFRAQDLHVTTKPDLTPVTDADITVEEAIRRTLARARPRDAVLGEEGGVDRQQQPPMDRRPHRRHQELRPGRPRVGDADRASRSTARWSRESCQRPQLGRRWWASRSGGAWTGRSLIKATACRVSDVSRLDDASLSYSSLSRLGGARAPRGLPRPLPPVLAHPRVRRLLVLHARRRRRRRPGRRARARAVRHGRPRHHRARGRGHRSPRSTARRGPTAGTRWPATGDCTSRRWGSSARCRPRATRADRSLTSRPAEGRRLRPSNRPRAASIPCHRSRLA